MPVDILMRLTLLLPVPAIGWGDAGHHFAASVANTVMKQSTRFWVRSQVGGEGEFDAALRAASIWADHEGQSKETDEYHFVHTPFRQCLPYVAARDCGFRGSGKCLVTGIERYWRESVDESASKETRSVAVKMLIHLIADLFQPLHTGFAEDHGGNDIDLLNTDSAGASLSLHGYWDRIIMYDSSPSGFGRKSVLERSRVNVEEIHTSLSTPEGVSAWLAGVVSHNAIEHTCGSAYKHTDGEWIRSGDLLDEEYGTTGRRLSIELLIDAGVALSTLLDHIANMWISRENAVSTIREAVLAEAEADRLQKIQDETTANPYAHLSIEEFDFDPEEIVLAASETTAPARPRGKKKRPAAETGSVCLVRVFHKWYITSRTRGNLIKEKKAFIRSITTYSVDFFSADTKRTVVMGVDLDAFPTDSAFDPEFVVQLIYKLKGRRYHGGKVVVPSGSSQSTTANEVAGPFDRLRVEQQDYPGETADKTTYFGTQLRVPTSGDLQIGISGFTILSDRDITRSKVMKKLGAAKFPLLSAERQIDAYIGNFLLTKRCSDVTIFEGHDGIALVTSTSALASSAIKSGSPIRVWGVSSQIDSSEPILVLIDQNLLEELVSYEGVSFLLGCARTNAHLKALPLRPTLNRELDEILNLITGSPLAIANEPRILAEEVFLYFDPRCPFDTILAIEWQLLH
jgi:hypothetical protein